MSLLNDDSRYGSIGQWLHWTTAALVIVLLVMGNVFDMEADEPGSMLFFWHSSLGVLVFLLAGIRVLWLLVSPPPQLPRSTGRLVRVLARSTHVALYALLFALPLSGWLAASSEHAAVTFFGVATIPEWPTAKPSGSSAAASTRQTIPTSSAKRASQGGTSQGGTDTEQEGEGIFKEIHEVLGNVLLALAVLHVLAALKHHFIDHDEVLRRMLPRARGSGRTSPSSREHGLT